MIVPPTMEPVPSKMVSPPAPNMPPPLTSSVLSVLINLPVRFTLVAAERVKLATPRAVKVPPRFSVPLPRLIAPGLVQLVGLRVRVPPLTKTEPLLVKVLGLTVMV